MVSTRTLSPYFSPNNATAPLGDSVPVRHFLGDDGRVLADPLVDQVSMLRSSVSETGAGWLKSKRSRSGATSEPFCSTCPPSVSRRGRMQEVRRRVVQDRLAAARCVHLGDDTVAPAQGAPRHRTVVQVLAAALGRVLHAERRAVGAAQHAPIADLAAGLGVERRGVEQDDAGLAFFEGIDGGALLEQADDFGWPVEPRIARELHGRVHADALLDIGIEPRCRGAAPGALLVHQPIETSLVDGQGRALGRLSAVRSTGNPYVS